MLVNLLKISKSLGSSLRLPGKRRGKGIFLTEMGTGLLRYLCQEQKIPEAAAQVDIMLGKTRSTYWGDPDAAVSGWCD